MLRTYYEIKWLIIVTRSFRTKLQPRTTHGASFYQGHGNTELAYTGRRHTFPTTMPRHRRFVSVCYKLQFPLMHLHTIY